MTNEDTDREVAWRQANPEEARRRDEDRANERRHRLAEQERK